MSVERKLFQRMILSVLAAAVCFVPVMHAQTAAGAAKEESTQAQIQKVEKSIGPLQGSGGETVPLDIETIMKSLHAPALTVAVIKDYKIIWAKAYGVTESGGSTPITTKTLFQAGSISKPVAATGMLKLVEQGKLSLDEDVNVKLKEWKVPENEFTVKEKVTLRRLASHTGGLTVHGFPGYDVDDKLPTVPQILDGVKPANTAPVRVEFVPGTKMQYSGGGITIEQLLMTEVSGKPFPALLKESVLDKIGMTDSSYEQPLPKNWFARTPSGTDVNGKAVHGKSHIYPEMAAAGLWTTPTDLGKFAIEIALSKNGKSNKVLSQKTVQEMLTPVMDEAGLGFFIAKERPGEFGHNGADEGFQALLVMNWETGDGFAAMSNSDNGVFVAQEYLRAVRKVYNWKYQEWPRRPSEEMFLISKIKGVDASLKWYDEIKAAGDASKVPSEEALNQMGYEALYTDHTENAIKFFQKNALEHPDSANVYDSLAEAYAKAGKKDLAIENYQKALKLNPENKNAAEQLKKLKE